MFRRPFTDNPDADVPRALLDSLAATEKRMREIEPAVIAAYAQAREQFPAAEEADRLGVGVRGRAAARAAGSDNHDSRT